jgi:hypothetical protein
MSITVYGPKGSGALTAYTAPNSRDVTLETLTFTVLADGTAGTHRVRVKYLDDAGNTFAVLDDLNVSASGQTTIYTYGLFLNASACTTADGWAVTDALPGTQLRASSSVTITAITDGGVEISGDTISAVVLQVNDPQAEAIVLQRIVEMPAATAV